MYMNQDSISIGWAKTEEWSDVMTMVWKTFLKYEGKEYTKEGIKNFFDFITDDKLYQLFVTGKYQVLVARRQEEIVGVASVRGGNTLSLLFVREDCQFCGIGRSLVNHLSEYLHDELGEESLLVNAAPNALEFYRRLGFRATAFEQSVAGIRITPMVKALP